MQQKNDYLHQTQILRRCGLHAVNNLLQQNKYTRQDFENVAEEIRKETMQSHCTYFLGNYDFNIIEKVLYQEQLVLEWVKQNEKITINLLKDPQIYGILINQIKELSFIEKVCQWEPRHWISIRKNVKPDNELEFYYHDSQLNSPQIKQAPDMIQQLIEFQKNKENYLILVKKK